MVERVFEVKIVDVAQMPTHTQNDVARQVAAMTPDRRAKYCGFVKVTYVTASPPRIRSVEPIAGDAAEYYEQSMTNADINVF